VTADWQPGDHVHVNGVDCRIYRLERTGAVVQPLRPDGLHPTLPHWVPYSHIRPIPSGDTP
jgi:hypothetical protein